MLCIKKVREEKGASLYWLAKTTGLAYRNLWAIERGADCKVSTLAIIAKVLNVSIQELFTEREFISEKNSSPKAAKTKK